MAESIVNLGQLILQPKQPDINSDPEKDWVFPRCSKLQLAWCSNILDYGSWLYGVV